MMKLLCRVLALFLAVLLLAPVTAPAEEAAAATGGASGPSMMPFAPTREDFLGTWRLLYVIQDGRDISALAVETLQVLLITEQGIGFEGTGENYPYTIVEKCLYRDNGTCLALVSRDLLVMEMESLGSLVYQRTGFPHNPFLGEWRVLMGACDGQIVRLDAADDAPILRFEEKQVVSVVGGVEEPVPCVYADGACYVDLGYGDVFVITIDSNGLMTMALQGVDMVYLLLPVQ